MPFERHEAFRDWPDSDDLDIITLKSLPAIGLSDSPSVPHQKSISALSKVQSAWSLFFFLIRVFKILWTL